jgi:hypothetical protein
MRICPKFQVPSPKPPIHRTRPTNLTWVEVQTRSRSGSLSLWERAGVRGIWDRLPLRRQFAQSLQVQRPERAYLLTEALVYIGVVFVILGIGYLAMYQCIDNCIVLRRNADDIVRVLHAGERWRADVRAATPRARLEGSAEDQMLRLQGARDLVDYRFADGVVYRRAGSGPWLRVLDRVKFSSFQSDLRQKVSSWRWELELEPRLKGAMKPGRVRPLFTFLAVPETTAAP